MSVFRSTKYSQAVMKELSSAGHSTNAEILAKIKNIFPGVSATTIHRVTARLYQNGMLAEAPAASDGSKRYDINTNPHDHFVCSNCDGIRDIKVADDFIPKISRALGGCKITGKLLIYGSCENCLGKGVKE